ncbi:U11/U12 small nuclear ribonucleoprotein-like [Thalictrum thalictroides]|uniref:U11/U12 small nuclear ribonucleoprotein-like n=1 Tax=Thalictrum thalictroides TaxID=46969 RepID=A0A7J6XH06_THATH|nr:U11/U12 small nuclear ribonucleoprotein-like [Thalictrum thalictroides]
MPVGISGGDDDDDNPRSNSFERRISCSNPFSSFSDGLPRLSFSYHKLPPPQIKLSVVKLDGSTFDVQVPGNATVRELKQSVEDVFAQSPKEGGGEISWSHVWGHFCLCYEGQKLTTDKDYVRSIGIKDGDQLQFIRHLSINYNFIKAKRDNDTYKEQPLPYAGSSFSEQEDSDSDHDGADSNSDRHEEDSDDDQHDEDNKYYNHEGDEGFIGHSEFKLAHFLKGWLSYSTLWFVGRTKSENRISSSRFSGQFLKLGSKLTLTRL